LAAEHAHLRRVPLRPAIHPRGPGPSRHTGGPGGARAAGGLYGAPAAERGAPARAHRPGIADRAADSAYLSAQRRARAARLAPGALLPARARGRRRLLRLPATGGWAA